MIRFEIPGEPGAKGRPRFSTCGGFTKTYTDKKTRLYESLVRDAYFSMVGNPDPISKEMEVEINAHFSIPKSVSKRKQAAMLSGIVRPTKKPDTDNIAKVILDSLNGIAFDDDKQVVRLVVNKFYSEKPHVEVCIWEREEREKQWEENSITRS